MRWCILRTSGRSTLSLADKLAEDGYGTWTPRVLHSKRAARTKGRVEMLVPMMPTFIFAPADRVSDLLVISKQTSTRYAQFAVFRYFDRIPVIDDRSLEPLRAAERKVAPKPKGRVYVVGEAVRITTGPAAGMSGIVEEGDGKFALVCFSGHFRVQVATFLLHPDSDGVCHAA